MEQKKDLIQRTIEVFAHTTGMKAAYQTNTRNGHKDYPEGLIRIDHQDRRWEFVVQARPRMTRTVLAMEKTQATTLHQDCILVTEYVTPPMADLLKTLGLFFMDAAGNGYIEKPPLFIFIKGNKAPENVRPAPTKRLFKPAGLKVVFALLNVPAMVDWPYREIAAITDVALGTVNWIFKDLKEMGFLVEMGGRQRKLTNVLSLRKRWVEGYPDQLRPKLGIERLKADQSDWWKDVDIRKYGACWGGEVAAAKLTKHLKPEKVIIYAHQLPGKLIIEKKLRKTTDGDIEVLKPFWKFDHELIDAGIAPPLLIYTDLMATGDDRNIETAGIIYDRYFAQPDRQDR
jgi:hypothetical protein